MCLCIFGVESINITSLSREHVTHALYLLYDDELYMLKSNKIYVMLCYVMLCYALIRSAILIGIELD